MNLLESFTTDCQLRRFRTIKVYRNTTRRYLKFLESMGLQPLEIDREVLKNYLIHLREKGLKLSSIEQEFSVLAAFYEYLEEEGKIQANPIPGFRKRYLRSYKAEEVSKKQFISTEELSKLVRTTLDTRARAIILLLFKTGVRLHELVELDVKDVDMLNLTITLKPTPKRSNRIVFFDYETAESLGRWLEARKFKRGHEGEALFLSDQGSRLSGSAVQRSVEQQAARCNLHNPNSKKSEDRLTPHCGRVWFCASLERAGMSVDNIKVLRGDVMKDSIEPYLRRNMQKIKESYLAHIPQLGI